MSWFASMKSRTVHDGDLVRLRRSNVDDPALQFHDRVQIFFGDGQSPASFTFFHKGGSWNDQAAEWQIVFSWDPKQAWMIVPQTVHHPEAREPDNWQFRGHPVEAKYR